MVSHQANHLVKLVQRALRVVMLCGWEHNCGYGRK